MIYVCREFALNSNSSVAKLLKYLDKTNQDLVITSRNALSKHSETRTAQTHVRQVSGTVANVRTNGKAINPSYKLCEEPAGKLINSWSRNHTLQIKRSLVSLGLNIQSLSRDGDLGIRSPRGAVPIGVILKVSYNLSNSTRVGQRSVMCYALSYTGYEAVSKAKYLLADYHADWLFFTDRAGNWQLLTKHR